MIVIFLSACNSERGDSKQNYHPEPNIWELESHGQSCANAYSQRPGNKNFYVVDQASQDRWLRYTPITDAVQIDNCEQTDRITSVEVYSVCNDASTPEDESERVTATIGGCGENFHVVIENRKDTELFIRFIAAPGAALNEYYVVFINEYGE